MWNLPATNAFTSEHARTLQELQITERAPGPILHDFDMLLAHLQDQPVLLTASHQLPLSMLPQVNARLAHPIQIDLKRPLQKTYPPIHGPFAREHTYSTCNWVSYAAVLLCRPMIPSTTWRTQSSTFLTSIAIIGYPRQASDPVS
jgi:hypothetical protein